MRNSASLACLFDVHSRTVHHDFCARRAAAANPGLYQNLLFGQDKERGLECREWRLLPIAWLNTSTIA